MCNLRKKKWHCALIIALSLKVSVGKESTSHSLLVAIDQTPLPQLSLMCIDSFTVKNKQKSSVIGVLCYAVKAVIQSYAVIPHFFELHVLAARKCNPLLKG